MTPTTATDLTAFLLREIEADEAAARAVYRSDHWYVDSEWRDDRAELVGGGKILASFTDEDPPVADHIARHDPAHVLAVCAAHKKVVELAQDANAQAAMVAAALGPNGLAGAGLAAEMKVLACEAAVKALAAAYADRLGWREEWAL